jgi:hypothetical protein
LTEPVRVVAVDWSGARDPAVQRRHIWTATAASGRLTGLAGGRTREEVVAGLCREADSGGHLVVGFDFAFGFPAWFTGSLGVTAGHDVWAVAARDGERWLEACRPPFWGRPGTTRPEVPDHLRCTERDHAPAKSVFLVGGAGAVGTGSLRGMPHLGHLRDAGFRIWPFDEPGLPLVVEIYPRALTGAVHKRNAAARGWYLDALGFPARFRAAAERSEDAFDAAVSALVMSRWAGWSSLRRPSDPVRLLEGEIWTPAAGAGVGADAGTPAS